VTRDQVRGIVMNELTRIAPEADPHTLRLELPLRDQVDVDSMDFLNFIIALHERFAIDIPEADYAKLSSLDALVDYLAARIDGGKRS
jgi:acyl carrier protein